MEEQSELSSQAAAKLSSDVDDATSTRTECCSSDEISERPLAGLGVCGMDIELEVSSKLSKRLRQDMRRRHKLKKQVPQLDGNHDTSSSDDDNFDDDDDDDDKDDDKDDAEEEGEEEVCWRCNKDVI